MVTALAPPVSVPEPHAQAEFDKALHILRRDGARPREVTPAAHFFSTLSLTFFSKRQIMAL